MPLLLASPPPRQAQGHRAPPVSPRERSPSPSWRPPRPASSSLNFLLHSKDSHLTPAREAPAQGCRPPSRPSWGPGEDQIPGTRPGQLPLTPHPTVGHYKILRAGKEQGWGWVPTVAVGKEGRAPRQSCRAGGSREAPAGRSPQRPPVQSPASLPSSPHSLQELSKGSRSPCLMQQEPKWRTPPPGTGDGTSPGLRGQADSSVSVAQKTEESIPKVGGIGLSGHRTRQGLLGHPTTRSLLTRTLAITCP